MKESSRREREEKREREGKGGERVRQVRGVGGGEWLVNSGNYHNTGVNVCLVSLVTSTTKV